MSDLDAGRLVLRPIDRETAGALLAGRRPDGLLVADDYPSQFSLEVMDLLVGPRASAVHQFLQFGPFFMVRRSDGAVIGEIGAFLDAEAATAQVGYSIVESCWNQGYATEALQVLVAALALRPDVSRVLAETLVGHRASRRVMEKVGMRQTGQRTGEEAGETVELVVYELLTGPDA